MIDFHHHIVLIVDYNHEYQNMMISKKLRKHDKADTYWIKTVCEGNFLLSDYEDDKNLTIVLAPRNDCTTSDSVDQPGRR